MRGTLATLAGVLALLGTAAGASGATAPTHGSIAGIVPRTVGLQASPSKGLPKLAGSPKSATFGFDAKYESLINQYLTDVEADSGGAANVYSVDPQYYDGSGSIQYQSTFAGSYVDHDPLPTSGCDDSYFGTSDPVCLTDAQLQAEIQSVLTAQGWHGAMNKMYFLMTPDGVGSCFDSTPASSGGECSTNAFCAYHNYFVDSNSENVIYANEPYVFSGCNDTFDGQGFPNDPNADTTINTISHEHNEAITDPITDSSGFAWLDPSGYEIGDLCAYTYGTQLGTVGGQPYNQLINGDHYSLQEEYSNADGGCVLKLGGAVSPVTFGSGPLDYYGGPVMHTNTTYAIYWLPTPGNDVAPAVTGNLAVNQLLTSTTGSWSGGPTDYSFQWQRCSAGGTGCLDIPGATASSYALTIADGGHTVRSTVSATNANGASPYAASAATGLIVPFPTATGNPIISGVAAVGRALATTDGTWNTAVTLTYQWQRCAANGSSCGAITGATTNTYALVSADAGHSLRAVVTATDAAGTTYATSAATLAVVDVPTDKSLPRISGRAKVGKRLSASHGSWTYSPAGYRYQWLRCSRSGAGCVPIRRATHSLYRVKKRDARHRLRLRVTATNAAGSRMATSSPSKLVAR